MQNQHITSQCIVFMSLFAWLKTNQSTKFLYPFHARKSVLKKMHSKNLATLITIILSVALFSGCAQLQELLPAPTNVDRDIYQPECKSSWKNKTVFIDFNTTHYYWRHEYATSLATDIRDKLMEEIVDDGCFNVQDTRSSTKYYYKIGIRIGSPSILVKKGVLNKISAKFRIKTYDGKNNIIKAASRTVEYERPAFVVVVNDSQEELLENYTSNVSTRIREAFYQSIGGKAKNKTVASGKYQTTAAVNFRTGPSTKTLVIEKLRKKTSIYPTGKKKGVWWQVEVNGEKGWLHKKFIKKI